MPTGATPANLLAYAQAILPPPTPLVFICGLAEISRFAHSGLTHQITLFDPGQAPILLPGVPADRRLHLSFYDLYDAHADMPVPEQEHIHQLLRFGDRIIGEPFHNGGRPTLLVSCHAGVSRSSAAAYILLCLWMGHGREREAMQYVLSVRPTAYPNARMVQLADAVLGRNGAMQLPPPPIQKPIF